MTTLLVITGVLAVLLALLAVPVDLAFQLKGIEELQGQFSVQWLFGLLRFRTVIPGSRKTAPAPKPKHSEEKPERGRDKRRKRPDFIAVLKQPAFRQRIYRFVKDVILAAHLQRLHLTLRLGLGDPADTGRLWAVMGPLSAMAENLRNARVRIEPEFMAERFEFDAGGKMRLIPLQLVMLTVAFALSPPSIRAWRTLSSSRA